MIELTGCVGDTHTLSLSHTLTHIYSHSHRRPSATANTLKDKQTKHHFPNTHSFVVLFFRKQNFFILFCLCVCVGAMAIHM